MAIGTLAAVGLAAGAAGSVISSAGANKASKNAANTAANSATQTAAMNNALTRDIYNQNAAALSPYMQRGNAAGNQINALLGIAGASASSGGTGSQWDAYLAANPDVMQGYTTADQSRFANPEAYAQWHYGQYGQAEGRQLPQAPSPTAPQAAGQNAAFDAFRNSTGYQFRQQEGQNALNNGYAGAGLVRSGAAMKAAQEYGQNLASGEFGNYLGQLQGQQNIGLGGASALAGVGQNYAGMVSQNNNNAGTAVANSALAQAANYQNPFGNALSLLGGGAVGYGRR